MPLRLEFAPDDLARVRVEPTLGPFAETLLALGVVRNGRTPLRLGGWLDAIQPVLSPRERALASFLWLNAGVGLDLFTVMGSTSSMHEAQASLADAPREVLAGEADSWANVRDHARRLGMLPRPHPLESVALNALRDGQSSGRDALAARIAAFHQSALAQYWPTIDDQLAAEEARLAGRLAAGGLGSLAAAVGPALRWDGETLELPSAGATRTCVTSKRLEGRSLVVVPSFFALEPSVYWSLEGAQPVLLIVPIGLIDARSLPRDPRTPQVGGELLGRTRAAVLEAVVRESRGTTELSVELGIAISGASQHAAVLRRAGLITTTRDGGRVLHRATELGEMLLAELSR